MGFRLYDDRIVNRNNTDQMTVSRLWCYSLAKPTKVGDKSKLFSLWHRLGKNWSMKIDPGRTKSRMGAEIFLCRGWIKRIQKQHTLSLLQVLRPNQDRNLKKKALDSVARTALRATYRHTLWLAGNNKQFGSWDLVSRPYIPTNPLEGGWFT